MTAPVILAFRIPELPRDDEREVKAVLTIEIGPLLIAGVRLCQNPAGEFFIKPPTTPGRGARLVFRGGPDRDALLQRAASMLHAMEPHRAAVTPLAPAPQSEPNL